MCILLIIIIICRKKLVVVKISWSSAELKNGNILLRFPDLQLNWKIATYCCIIDCCCCCTVKPTAIYLSTQFVMWGEGCAVSRHCSCTALSHFISTTCWGHLFASFGRWGGWGREKEQKTNACIFDFNRTRSGRLCNVSLIFTLRFTCRGDEEERQVHHREWSWADCIAFAASDLAWCHQGHWCED